MLLWHFSLEMQRDMLETDVTLRQLQDQVDSLPQANQVDPAWAQPHDAGKRQMIERMVSHVDDDRQIISYANTPPKKQVRVSDRKGQGH